MTDEQVQERLLKMETETLGAWRHHRLTLPTAQRMMQVTCQSFGIEPCIVSIEPERGCRGMYDSERHHERGVILLDPKEGANALVLSHELAHHVTEHLHPTSHKLLDHGPLFRLYYSHVVEIVGVMPGYAFRRVLRSHGLPVKVV